MNDQAMKTVINRGGKTYLVSTVYAKISPVGWETMVFRCEPDGDVWNYMELAVARYDNAEAARIGHDAMVASFNPADKL